MYNSCGITVFENPHGKTVPKYTAVFQSRNEALNYVQYAMYFENEVIKYVENRCIF